MNKGVVISMILRKLQFSGLFSRGVKAESGLLTALTGVTFSASLSSCRQETEIAEALKMTAVSAIGMIVSKISLSDHG